MIALLCIDVLVVGGWWFVSHRGVPGLPSERTDPENSRHSTTPPSTDFGANDDSRKEYAGTIVATSDGRNVYTSNKLGIRFTYPHGWRIGDNALGYGTFQLFNYDESVERPGFTDGMNKIEAVVIPSNPYEISGEYPEKSRAVTQIQAAGQRVTQYDERLEFGSIRGYLMRLPTVPGKFFAITIYGDPANFHTLDEIIKSVELL